MLSRCCIFHPEDSDPLLRMKFTACRKLPWCAGRLQYSAHYRYPQSFPQSAAAVSACSHFSPPYGLTGTGDRSDLAIKSLNDLCCRRTIHRSKRLAKTLRLMCGSVGTEEIFLIHPCISSKCTVERRRVESSARAETGRAQHSVPYALTLSIE